MIDIITLFFDTAKYEYRDSIVDAFQIGTGNYHPADESLSYFWDCFPVPLLKALCDRHGDVTGVKIESVYP